MSERVFGERGVNTYMLSYNPYQVIRDCKGKIYWFNQDGILECKKYNSSMEGYSIDIYKLMNEFGVENAILLKKCIAKLNVGDSIDTFEYIISNTKIEKRELPKGVDRFVTKIGIPNYERFPENKNKKTFDFIRVDVNVLSNVDGRKEYIVKHHDEICNMVLDKIKSSYRFKKFGVPINFLNLEKATFIPRISVIEFLFSLKQIENII